MCISKIFILENVTLSKLGVIHRVCTSTNCLVGNPKQVEFPSNFLSCLYYTIALPLENELTF